MIKNDIVHLSFRPKELYTIMECSIRLFPICTIRMCGAEEYCVRIVRASLCLALTAIAMFEEHCPDAEEFKKLASKDQAFFLLDKALRNWIDNHRVVGKEMFGGHVARERAWRGSSLKLAKVENEILVGITLTL